ncbi:MAG: hypothetical protein QNJ45_19625 [Ardenticatenaceae bacterium]|nr:hypothetical protein [Ardenticatenaceae bacterium]
MSNTIEIVLFELVDGVAEDDFLAAVDAMQDDLNQMSGYIDRELSRDKNGRWVDVLHWASLDEAMAAAEALMSWPSGQKFGSMIDPESIQMLHTQPRYQHL